MLDKYLSKSSYMKYWEGVSLTKLFLKRSCLSLEWKQHIQNTMGIWILDMSGIKMVKKVQSANGSDFRHHLNTWHFSVRFLNSLDKMVPNQPLSTLGHRLQHSNYVGCVLWGTIRDINVIPQYEYETKRIENNIVETTVSWRGLSVIIWLINYNCNTNIVDIRKDHWGWS